MINSRLHHLRGKLISDMERVISERDGLLIVGAFPYKRLTIDQLFFALEGCP
ncbi:MAG: hypothetical protein WKF84_29635 [Pyrinomonadaceae bacterium]